MNPHVFTEVMVETSKATLLPKSAHTYTEIQVHAATYNWLAHRNHASCSLAIGTALIITRLFHCSSHSTVLISSQASYPLILTEASVCLPALTASRSHSLGCAHSTRAHSHYNELVLFHLYLLPIVRPVLLVQLFKRPMTPSAVEPSLNKEVKP